ncbi:Ig-like domain-containing protein, partial [Pseudoalteromonas distincta]|uniref:Ig-like domain-containing protein n=1 Tax=Pseudoalteromonas distincta TaxID=77608 RepID=UPI0039E9D88F
NGGSQTLTTIILGNGTWQVGATQALAEGDFTITATIIDAAGNEASNMSAGTINLNPVNLSINAIETDNDTTPIVTGGSDLEVGSEVTVTFTDSNNDVHSVVTQVGANGEWAVSAQEVLSEGTFSVTVTATDAAGNDGSATSTGETDYTG